MRIGVVSDTHNHLGNVAQIVEIFNELAVDRVVHTGDVTQGKVVDAMAGLRAPLTGVFGNNDEGEREALETRAQWHGVEFFDGPLELDWHGRRIIVVHDPRELDRHLQDHHDLALHGHTHLFRRELVGETVVFNPGECAGIIRGLNAIGVVDLETLECTRHRF